MMSSSAVNPLMQTLAAKPPLIDRTHYGGPSSGPVHHSHHHSSGKGGGKHSVALTALTLLSFLFFLNILQNCLQEHMDDMNPQVMIMQARVQEQRIAEKRKGETELFNATVESKEARSDPEAPKQKQTHMTQIPVKLRTGEKAVRPHK